MIKYAFQVERLLVLHDKIGRLGELVGQGLDRDDVLAAPGFLALRPGIGLGRGAPREVRGFDKRPREIPVPVPGENSGVCPLN